MRWRRGKERERERESMGCQRGDKRVGRITKMHSARLKMLKMVRGGDGEAMPG